MLNTSLRKSFEYVGARDHARTAGPSLWRQRIAPYKGGSPEPHRALDMGARQAALEAVAMSDPDLRMHEAGFDPCIVPSLREALREAASLALPFFRLGEQTRAHVWSKTGGSPVTEADVAVDTFLKVRLSEIEPRAAWLSEETSDDPIRLHSELVWIVDPIDGTRAFLSGNPDWSIAVALLSRGQPVLGFVHGPSLGHDYEAFAGGGAWRNGARLSVATRTALEGARVTGPAPLFDRMMRGAGRLGPAPNVTKLPRIPSLALRVARVAEGSIDVGLISEDSRDWDLAAADLILREAGGSVVRLDGTPTVYNERDPTHGKLLAVPDALKAATLAALGAT